MDMNYGQPQSQQSQPLRCHHTVLRLQVFQQGVHAECFQCGAMALYPNGARETAVLGYARKALDVAFRQMCEQREREHIAQYARPADPSLPLGAAMRRAPGWWSR